MKQSVFNCLMLVSMIFSCVNMVAQESKISGSVKEPNGISIPGANVLNKNTKSSTQTNFDGNFTIDAKHGDVLSFSFIGMKTTEITVGLNSVYNIVLNDDSEQLSEVVVVGYGSQKKSDVTGAVARANLEAFENVPNPNIIQSLQGTVAGLNIGQINTAGGTPSISIRGTTSLGGNNSVLIVLDGVIYTGSLNDINPDDIASVDVLKDASSAAVYGAQGANGVLLITSKKGKKNRSPQISLRTSFTAQSPTVKTRPLRRDGYLKKVRDLYWDQAYLAPNYTEQNPNFIIEDFVDPALVNNGQILDADYDWWDAATKTGSISEYNASVSGGGESVSYLLSAGHVKQDGYIINDFNKRTTVRANIDVNLKKWWTVGMQAFAAFSDYSGSEPSISGIIRQTPLTVPFDDQGELIPFPTGTIYSNPLMTYYVDNLSKGNNFFGNFYSDMKIPFIKGLSYRVSLGNNLTNSQNYGSSIYDAGQTGRAYKNHSSRYDWTLDNVVTYEKKIGENHDLAVTLLYGASERKSENTDAYGEGFTDLTLSYNSLQLATNQFTSSGGWSEALNYQMGRVNYKFKDKYLLTGTVRRDGFSGFAENKKFGVFPSAAVAWVITKEDFFKSNVVDFLKLRAGYGSNGNLTSRYFSLSRVYRYVSYVYGDGGTTEFAQGINSLANANLEWEATTGINLGLDFELFKGRLSGNVEYYDTETKNQLFTRSIPSINGLSSVNVNLGNIRNKGVEFSLTSKNITTNDFTWSTTLNYSHNKNEIVSLTGLDEDEDGKEDDIIADRRFIGRSIGTIYDYEAGSIYQIGDDIPTGYYLGTRRVIDQNNDGVIDSNDRKVLGTSDPKFRAGLLNSFTFKNLTLNVFLNTVQGGKNGYLGYNVPTYGGRQDGKDNLFNVMDNTDFWSPSNPDGKDARYITAPKVIPGMYESRNFVRLQDISVAYNLPKKIIDNLGMGSLKIYLSGKNLATWTKWRGWDPETGQGLSDTGRPVLKSYSIGLNATF